MQFTENTKVNAKHRETKHSCWHEMDAIVSQQRVNNKHKVAKYTYKNTQESLQPSQVSTIHMRIYKLPKSA
jgi:hypothetical protein